MPLRLPLPFGVILTLGTCRRLRGKLAGQRGEIRKPSRINCQDKNAMKRIMRTTVRVVNYDKRNWIDTRKPEGTESDHNGYCNVMWDEQTIPGLKMPSKAFIVNMLHTRITNAVKPHCCPIQKILNLLAKQPRSSKYATQSSFASRQSRPDSIHERPPAVFASLFPLCC